MEKLDFFPRNGVFHNKVSVLDWFHVKKRILRRTNTISSQKMFVCIVSSEK